MPHAISMDLQQKQSPSLKQLQRLIMTRQMQQAIHLLQMPIMELSPIIEMELEENPVLQLEDSDEENNEPSQEEDEPEIEENGDTNSEESLNFNDRDFEILYKLDDEFRDHFAESGDYVHKRTNEEEKLHSFLESSITSEISFFEYLMKQVEETFAAQKDKSLAEAIVGNLDESGYLKIPLEEIASLQSCNIDDLNKILTTIQTFQPTGVGARNLRESLLIQLRTQGKQNTLAYTIIESCFDDLLHNRILNIKKVLHCTSEDIGDAIDTHISKLDLHPAANFSRKTTPYIIPDAAINQEGDELIVSVNDDTMPRLRINRRYLRMLEDPTLGQETKEFILQKIGSAKWLLKNILQRNNTLEKIATFLVKHDQSFFLNPEGSLVPLTMKMVADELQLHESTIARAVSNKYIDTPRGILPLRFFFTNALETNQGEEIASTTVRNLIQEIIRKEDKTHPFSDEAISSLIKENGIKCARRTVAKYRALLNLGSAQQRRKFTS